MSVCFWESGGTSCPLPSGYPKVNQDFICLLLGERRHESSAGSPKIFDLLGCFSTMTRSHRSIRPHCRTRRYRTRRCCFKVSCDCVAGSKGSASPHRVPKSKPRLRLFAFGKAEVRVASMMTRSSVCAISLPNAARVL
jgi:hypothetical protein